MRSGKIIASLGMPGAGKSSVSKELGKLLSIPTFLEPEESQWPDAVNLRKISGNFTALMWFRSIRVPMIYKAQQLAQNGITSILDCFYDKLFWLYMAEPGMKWLFSANDPYFEEMYQIAKKDYDMLPDADILIFYELEYDVWCKFLQLRNRDLDNDPEFANSFNTQTLFKEAAERYCFMNNCKLITCAQSFSSPAEIALQLLPKIYEAMEA